MSEALHENCYDICATKAPELPFLSVQEGNCVRNCMTKFSVFYPTLQQNLAHADFRHYEQQLLQEGAKKHAEIRKAQTDPWEKERNSIIQQLIQRKNQQYSQ